MATKKQQREKYIIPGSLKVVGVLETNIDSRSIFEKENQRGQRSIVPGSLKVIGNLKATNPRPQLNRDYEALKFEAAVLYIKKGLSAKEICLQLDISVPTISRYRKAGRWDELRPDMDVLTQYKAAGLYIEKKMTTGKIAQALSISESTIKLWIFLYGWEAARLVSGAQQPLIDIVTDFCSFFKRLLPKEIGTVEFAKSQYLKEVTQKTCK